MDDIKKFLCENNTDVIQSFIQSLRKNQSSKNKFFYIVVLCAFSDNQTIWKETFSDVYQKYAKTFFMTTRLNEEAMEYISSRYVEEVMKLYKEVCNDI